jgi:GTP pyrophosphokinase
VLALFVCSDDLKNIDQIIKEIFTVHSFDNKLENSESALGYISNHYICSMSDTYSGPRYDKIGGLLFEIQVRTLCMHCWAAVSHYIDYKGDWDVPKDLKMSLSALSGLFYVADTQFQQFSQARVESQARAKPTNDDELNLDTLAAYLPRRFPGRQDVSIDSVSNLVQELKEAGYTRISQIDDDLGRSMDAFTAFEKEHPAFGGRRGGYYNQVGVCRSALTIANTDYLALRGQKNEHFNSEDYEKFRHLVKSV